MRKIVLLFAAVLAMALFAVPVAMAGHQDPITGEQNCAGNPGDPGTGGLLFVDQNGDGSNSGHVTVGSCDNVAPDGQITAGGNLSAQCGYIIVDGDPTNGSEADGFVGAEGNAANPSIVTVVGPADGSYHSSCPTA